MLEAPGSGASDPSRDPVAAYAAERTGEAPAQDAVAAPVAYREPAPPVPMPQGPSEAFCTVCLAPFDRPAYDSEAQICPACLNLTEPGVDLGQNEFAYAPATEDHFVERIGTSALRPRAIEHKKTGLRGSVVTLLVLACLAAAFGVYHFSTREGADRTEFYLQEVKVTTTPFVVEPPQDTLIRLETATNLRILRESMRASFKGELDAVIDIFQDSLQTTELLRAATHEDGAYVELQSECRLVRQEGKDGRRDARETDIYPWIGYTSRLRALLTSSDRPLNGEDNKRLIPGRDITPFLTLGSLGAPTGPVTPGTKWLDTLYLPFLSDRSGRLAHAKFPCTFVYKGRRLVKGYDCIAIQVAGKPPRRLPEVLKDMNRALGKFRGVLFYDVSNGIIVEGHIDLDVSANRSAGRIEERVRVLGQVEIKRR